MGSGHWRKELALLESRSIPACTSRPEALENSVILRLAWQQNNGSAFSFYMHDRIGLVVFSISSCKLQVVQLFIMFKGYHWPHSENQIRRKYNSKNVY